MTRLRDLGEFELIRRVVAAGAAAGAGAGDASVRIGPGDDAAVVRAEAGRDLVVTTDAFVAGRHWLDGWIDPGTLGARLARANLSDLAAMAARPRWATLALGLGATRDAAWVEAVQAGLAAALRADGASLVGGNVAAVEREDWLCLTLIGDVQPERVWTRGGARPGDLLAATGFPGRAGAAVALVRKHPDDARAPEWSPLLSAWRSPASRVDLARALAASGAVTAAIDLSDGLAGDLGHLCEASGVGAELLAAGWPEDAPLAAAAARLGRTARDLRLGPSDDYELLLAIDPEGRARAEAVAREAGVPLHVVGRITAAPGVIEWIDAGAARAPVEPRSYDHFA